MRLIDADALMEREKVNPFFHAVGARDGKSLYNACLTYMAIAVDNAPTIDAVPVVRCKDCKHRRDDEDYASGHYCVKRPSNGGYFCEDDDFCSYGERKDGDA